MSYDFASHETRYAGVVFRSRLEARWAAFFDVMREVWGRVPELSAIHPKAWEWEYEPCDLIGWSPDFKVNIPCHRSGCHDVGGPHPLFVEVKPKRSMFLNHVTSKREFSVRVGQFANGPSETFWDDAIGDSGGGDCDLASFIGFKDSELQQVWRAAGNRVQYKHRA